MKKHIALLLTLLLSCAPLFSACGGGEATGPTASTTEADATLVVTGEEESLIYSSAFGTMGITLPRGWAAKLTTLGAPGFGFEFWPQGHREGSVILEMRPDWGCCYMEMTEESLTLGGHNTFRATYEGSEVWDFMVVDGTFPGKCVITNHSDAAWWSAYGETADRILNSLMLEKAPGEILSFALTWGVYGISSYDSETGRLVKTCDATEPDDYVTFHPLSSEEAVEIFSILEALDVAAYPDEYQPSPDYASNPPEKLLLEVRTLSGAKTVRVKECALYAPGADEKAQAFLDACHRIADLLMESQDWLALPEYEFFYQ